jgi:hypothetical protein
MARLWWKILLFNAIAGPLLVLAYYRFRIIAWVGSTDFPVELALLLAASLKVRWGG